MKKTTIKLVVSIIQSVRDMIEHDGMEYAGYLAFLFMLSIFPFLVFIMALIGAIDDEKLASILIELIVESPWATFIDALKPRILEITSTPPQSFLTIAILGAIWTASSIFEALRMILNKAYRVTHVPHYLLRRLVSILEFLVAIFCTIFLLFLLVIVPHGIEMLKSHSHILSGHKVLSILDKGGDTIRMLILWFFSATLINTIYSRIPNLKLTFVQAMPGSIFTIVAWYLASQGFHYYIGHFPQMNFIYGSIAGVIIALLYFYICSIVFIVGGELNYRISIGVKKC